MTTAGLLLSLEGRARRRDVLAGLVTIAVFAVLLALLSSLWLGGRWASLLVTLAVAWPLAGLLGKRYHDRDRAAWPRFVMWFGLTALLVVLQQIEFGYEWKGGRAYPYHFPIEAWPRWVAATLPNLLSLGAAGLATLGVMEALIMPGTDGPNRFGPDPRGPGTEE